MTNNASDPSRSDTNAISSDETLGCSTGFCSTPPVPLSDGLHPSNTEATIITLSERRRETGGMH
jgi:hypothetical protein